MKTSEFTDVHLAVIKKFVLSDAFLEIKDAFISHTPEGVPDGKANADDDSKNLGKLIGTRYVFNQLETIAKQPPQKQQGRGQQSSASPSRDPDLDS